MVTLYLSVWDVQCFGCRLSGCRMFEMSDVQDVECSGYAMWDVRNVECLGCRMFEMRSDRGLGVWGCGIFGMWDVWDVQNVGYLGCCMFGV